jgi:hypothetical protein
VWSWLSVPGSTPGAGPRRAGFASCRRSYSRRLSWPCPRRPS